MDPWDSGLSDGRHRTWHAAVASDAGILLTDPVTGAPHPTPGALQIVFCDLGTPSDKWNVYAQLRDDLAQRGIPRDQVRFMHEAKNDAEKGRLFAA